MSETVIYIIGAISSDPDYKEKFAKAEKKLREMGFKYAETNACLETNVKIHAMWEYFEKEQHKRRWVFGKEL